MVDVKLEQPRVGHEPDEDEHAADRELLAGAELLVFDRLHLAVADDLFDAGLEDELDLRVGARSIDQDRLRAQLVSAMEDVDLLGVAGQEFALLDGGVTATDHGQLLALEEGAIADRAVADPAAPELLLPGDAEVAGQAARGHDQGRRADLVTRLQPDDLRRPFFVDLLDRFELADLEAEFPRVVAHLGRQLRAQDGLVARVVLDQLGVQQLPAKRAPVQQQRLEVHPGRVEAGRQPGGAASDDDYIVIAHSIRSKCGRLVGIPNPGLSQTCTGRQSRRGGCGRRCCRTGSRSSRPRIRCSCRS